MSNQQQITDLLKNEYPEIKTMLCLSCRFIKIYDRRNQPYIVRFETTTEDEVRKLAEAIRSDNAEGLKLFMAKSKAKPRGTYISPNISPLKNGVATFKTTR